jgi:hypothetical protein
MDMKMLRAISCIVAVFAAVTQAKGVDLVALTQETQKLSQKQQAITLAWWVPEEFWRASLAQSPAITAAQMEEMLKVLRPYTMVAVLDGAIGPFGGVTYNSEEWLRSNTRLVDQQGKSYSPYTEDKIDADTKNMLQVMKPVLGNMLGPLGQNIHFLLFPAKTDKGIAIASAKDKGHFTVKVGDKEFKWRLPLDALLPAKVCPSCKQEAKGSWNFCPWCGTKLDGK